MVSGSNKQPVGWPFIYRLDEDCNEPLQFSDFSGVIPTLGDCIELVQQKDGRLPTSKIQHNTDVGSRFPEEATHDRRQVESQKRPMKLLCEPASGKCLAESRLA